MWFPLYLDLHCFLFGLEFCENVCPYAALTPMWIYLRIGYKCNLAPICNGHTKLVGVCKHSWGARKHSRGLAKIRNMLLKFARKAYLQHFVTIVIHFH